MLRMIPPHENKYFLKHGVVGYENVIGHLHTVLKGFANKPEYTRFYIGITSDIDRRLREHQGTRGDFALMVPIFEEPTVLVEDGFDRLEREAINRFRDGIRHPETKQMLLKCDNGPQGALPKTTLYILVG